VPRDEQTTGGAKGAVSEQGFETAKFLKDIAASLAPIELRPGDILMRQGEVSDAAYFLESGSVLVYAETPYGPVSLATLEGPRLVGEIGAFADLERTASVKAVGAARAFRIGRAPLLELGRKSPELLMSVVRQLGQQIDSVNKAVALYTNALAALERREFDEAILSDLAAPSPRLAEFAGAFRRFAGQILGKRRQQDEMAAAAMIQKSFLPKESAVDMTGGEFEIRAKMRPAREVGGDFYDYFMLDADRLAVVIGDVCGKGTPASLFMAVVVTVLRAAAREEADAASTIARANSLLCRDNAASMFATAFYGVLDLRSGALEYCNCGHNAPVHILASGEFQRLVATGLPLALYESLPAAASKIQLDPGDSLVLFTDGVTEAVNLSQEEFGEPLLLETLLGSRQCTMSELVSRLFAVVDAFAQEEEQADDITCVAIRRR
jgi:serine phosphatase RsbU (regulator of sigma subunit)